MTQAPGGSGTVIILKPHHEVEMPVAEAPAVIDQYGRAFIPRLVVVRAGQAVSFSNSEDELHNVHVKDEAGESVINVGMPILGGTFEHVFEHPGDYAVSCNVHPEMAAQIVVTASPFAVVADRQGEFVFAEVPTGTYDLVVRQGLERHERVVEVEAPVTQLDIELP